MNDKLAPGTYQARMIHAALAVHSTEDYIKTCLEALSRDGLVVIEQQWQFPAPIKLKMHSYADMFEMPYCLPRKGDRHHKRKPQPNRGPQGRNQWS